MALERFDEETKKKLQEFVESKTNVYIEPIGIDKQESYWSFVFKYRGLELEAISFLKDKKDLLKRVIFGIKSRNYDIIVENFKEK